MFPQNYNLLLQLHIIHLIFLYLRRQTTENNKSVCHNAWNMDRAIAQVIKHIYYKSL